MSDATRKVLDGQVWRDFCDQLKAAGEVILHEDHPASELDCAEGWRYLTRLLRLGLESKLEFANAEFPVLYSLSHETGKIGADNPDNFYQNATIDGSRHYVIRGHRGTTPYISWGTKANRYDIDGTMASTGELDSSQIQVGADGRFEIAVGPERRGANWLPTTPTSNMLLIRQTFTDRSTQRPAVMSVSQWPAPASPKPLSADALAHGLTGAARFVLQTAQTFAGMSRLMKQSPNNWAPIDQAYCQKIGGDPNIFYLHGYWELERGQALVVEGRVPRCDYWNVQVDNWWMESLDYRYLPVTLNSRSARCEADGSFRLVIAEENPGVPNFLCTAGHRCGTLALRWVRADSHPIPTCRVVPIRDLAVK